MPDNPQPGVVVTETQRHLTEMMFLTITLAFSPVWA